jgi:hypothetical protein
MLVPVPGATDYEILLDQARRQVDQQVGSLDTLRTRSTAVVSVGGIVAALFATHFLPHAGNLTLAAFASLFAVVALGVFILWPREWNIGVPLPVYQQWIEDYHQWRLDGEPDLAESLTEELAGTLVIAYSNNRDTYKWMARAYSAQVFMLVVEIGFWVVATL